MICEASKHYFHSYRPFLSFPCVSLDVANVEHISLLSLTTMQTTVILFSLGYRFTLFVLFVATTGLFILTGAKFMKC